MGQLVSVVIPVYNMAKFIGPAIDSVLNGTYKNVEVLCVNDGSSDNTEQVVRQFTDQKSQLYDSRVRYFSQPNQGKPVAVNRGISEMRGKYFTLLDADDLLTAESISSRVQALKSDPSAEIAIGGFDILDESGMHAGGRSCPDTEDPDYLRRAFYLAYKTPFSLCTCLIQRSILERVGPFDPYLNRCQDGDYAIRCMGATKGVTTVDESVYLYRKHRESVRSRIKMRLKTVRYRPYVIKKNFKGAKKYVYAIYVFLLDMAKMMYEFFANYKK